MSHIPRLFPSRELKFLQVTYEMFHCGLKQGFLLFMVLVNRLDFLKDNFFAGTYNQEFSTYSTSTSTGMPTYASLLEKY